VADQDEPRAPLADEAVRLVGAVQDWARQTFPTPADGHGGPECQWCPLCQFVAVLRGDRPEVTERVAEAGTALASAFRALVDAASSGAATPAEPKAPRVQRIDLGNASE
jgi:hypothetical protein